MPGPRVPASEAPAVWATFLAELWRWVAEHGGRLVPTTAVTVVDGQRYMLGSRVKNARVYYHRGSLTREEITQLEAIPSWSWDGRNAYSRLAWRDQMAALRQYAAVHGSAAGLEQHNPALTKWLREQRSRELTPDERAQLDAIPGALEPPSFFLDELLDALTRWIAAVPGRDARHVLRSTTVLLDDRRIRLGERAADWRLRYRRGELTKWEIARFEAVPGWSWAALTPGRKPRAVEAMSRD